MVSNNNGALVIFENELTIEKAIDGTSLRKLSSSIEKNNVIKSIAFLTNRVADNFNVGKKFTADQSLVMAYDLFEVFGYENLEDVVLMFKLARQGKIGDGKDFKLDSQTVFHKWIPDYLNLKAEFRENEHIKAKKQIDTLERSTSFYELRRIQSDKTKKQEKVIIYVDKITKDIDRETLENLITEWSNDEIKKEYVGLLKNKRLIIKGDYKF